VGWPVDTGPGINPDAKWTGALTSPVTVNNLTRGVTYQCKVRARYGERYGDERGDRYEGPLSEWSPPFRVPVVRPPAPANVRATAQGGRKVAVTWTPVANDTGAPVTFSTRCTSSNGGTARTAVGGNPTTVTGLTAKKTYTCAVTATNVAGSTTSAPSSSVRVT
jgi:hypothetical protein